MLERLYLTRVNRSTGVHRSQFRLLKYIVMHEGCTQNDAAEFLMVTPASVAQSSKRMEASGLILRRADEADRRRNLLFATQKGKDAYHTMEGNFSDMVDLMFTGFEESELDALENYLRRMSENLAGGRDISYSELMNEWKAMEEMEEKNK